MGTWTLARLLYQSAELYLRSNAIKSTTVWPLNEVIYNLNHDVSLTKLPQTLPIRDISSLWPLHSNKSSIANVLNVSTTSPKKTWKSLFSMHMWFICIFLSRFRFRKFFEKFSKNSLVVRRAGVRGLPVLICWFQSRLNWTFKCQNIIRLTFLSIATVILVEIASCNQSAGCKLP